MLDLSPHIKSLLYNHDCVIIPNFGGFVANPHPARINKLKSRIDPPFKEIGFNPRLTKNDGLLANHIYNEKKISYEESISIIAKVVDEIKSTVNAGNTYRINEIGSFYLDSNKSLRFSSDNKTNFNLDFFGFEAVQIISLEKKKIPVSVKEKPTKSDSNVLPLEKVTKTEVEEVIKFKTDKKTKYSWGNIAMVAACIPLLLYLLWIPTRIDFQHSNVKFQASDLNPYVKAPCPTYEFRGDNLPTLVKYKAEKTGLFKELALSKKAFISHSFFDKENPNFNPNELVTIQVSEFKALAVTTKVANAFVPPTLSKRYYVVAGCFEIYENANNFVNKLRLQGYNSVLIDKKGNLYRVGIFGSNFRSEILESLDAVRSKGFKDAWVLKK